MRDTFKSYEYWIRHAMTLAERALPEDVPVGAVLLGPTGEILGEGWNTREQHHDGTGHAELMALRQAGERLKNWRMTDCTLFVTLEPCPMCASALYQVRLGAVVFGAPDPVQGAMGSAMVMGSLYPTPMRVVGGVLETPCREQLQLFFQNRRM